MLNEERRQKSKQFHASLIINKHNFLIMPLSSKDQATKFSDKIFRRERIDLIRFIVKVEWMAMIAIIIDYCQHNSEMKPLYQALLLLALVVQVTCLRSFCSMVCKSTNCNGNTQNDCNGNCQANWVVSGATCNPNPAWNWFYFDKSPDLGGTLVVSGATGPTTSACGSFNMYGLVQGPTTITVSTATTGIVIPYFQMIVYVGIISTDVGGGGGGGGGGNYWQSSTAYFLEFSDNLQSNALRLSSKSQNEQYCYRGGKSEYWNRFAVTYNYNVTGVPFTWSIRNNETNATAQWGIKQFIIITRQCHWACTGCYGVLSTQCYSCVYNSTMTIWQSNNTCNQSCLTRFGYTLVPNICVYCDLRCTVCFDSPTNCSACTRSGTWTAYLYSADPTNITCLQVCPDGFFANKTAQTCDPCNTNCSTCLNTANYCLSCVSGWGWTGWSCYQPCPVHYYLNPNLINCTKCSLYCDTCIGPSTLCTICTLSGTYKAYLMNTTNLTGTCDRLCLSGYYPQDFGGLGPNLCLACDPICTLCTGNPTPCQQCIAGYYLYSGTCVSPCPNGTFESNVTGYGLCLDCDVVCVTLTINMYFPSALNEKLYIDMLFSQSLNFTTFNYEGFQNITIESANIVYTLDMFTVSYEILGPSSYRIVLQPKGYIFLYNATFTVTTIPQPSPIDTSIAQMPFKVNNYLKSAQVSWFLIHGPPFSALEKGVMTSFSTLATKTNAFLTLPYIQQVKKSGVFNLIFSGAQITSCSMLSNQIQSQNLYEGVRFWAVFVFFDAPPYQKISDKTKNFVSPTVEDRIRDAQQNNQFNEQFTDKSQGRKLFSTNSMYWRFQRTGQTSFFIYDVYMPMFLIITCWILLLIGHCCKQKSWYKAYATKIFSGTHKVHQISIMYVTMGAIVQFIYFEPSSSQRIISAIICIIFNVYFIFYELYIYYDMIRYPLAEIGNKTYEYYVLRYGCFLKNVRYEEYDINEEWSPRHWFRPYNYHILSYYKKFIMMISLPLFYNTVYAQMGTLFIIQLLEVLRLWFVWPFVSKRRNFIRLSLQLSLLLFFLINMIQISLLQKIMSSDAASLGETITIFYGLGWAGFAACFYFNVTHIVIGLYDFCVGLKTTNRQKMDAALKKYYYNKIKQYEKDNDSSSKQLVNKWVKLGNLNNRSYGDMPEINVRVQQYIIKRTGAKFEFEMKKISSLQMKTEKNYRKSNNTTSGGKIQHKCILSQSSDYKLYSVIDEVYKQFENQHIQTVILKTFLNVDQKKYKEGQQIPLDVSQMFQRVQLISYDNEKEEKDLPHMLEGFPLDRQLFNNLY